MTRLNKLEMAVDYNEVIGERIHRLIWRQRRSQTEVANALGIAQSALSRKLRGDRGWDVNELYALAEILGVGITDLIPNERKPRPGDYPGGASAAELPRLDSNQQPFGRRIALLRPAPIAA